MARLSSVADDLQLSFVLHTRPWRETSMLVDIFTENHGKLCLCAKGIRNKKAPKRSLLQPLTLLYMSWKGRGDLATLITVEAAAPAIKLSSTSLYSAFYINELMVRLLHRHDPHPQLFHQYHNALEQLVDSKNLEQSLRVFELQLLTAIGYGLTLTSDMNGEPLESSTHYLLHKDGLFQRIDTTTIHELQPTFEGRHLISIAKHNWQESGVLVSAKRLLRIVLKSLLGDKPLQSRNLFRRMNR